MRLLPWVFVLAAVAACQSPPATPGGPTVMRERYGAMPDGVQIDVVTLRNANGITVRAITFGGIITSIEMPDRTGRSADIALGFDSLDGYLTAHPYFGAIIGRYGNRIGAAAFTLDGTQHTLAKNNGPNSLHGGEKGFDKQVWNAQTVTGRTAVELSRTSVDGEEGFPGNLSVRVTYELTDANELIVDYFATADRATPINLTQHTYFNLAGEGSGDILGHQLMLNAGAYTPVNDTLIPTGELAPVQGTPFDFRQPTAIGARINEADAQLTNGRGYDHNWVVNRAGDGLQPAARVVEPASGRTLEIKTTEPGIQFYSGNFLDGTIKGKRGHVYGHRAGFCLETQHFPDSPNKPAFPSTILRPGQEYRSKTVFTFGVER